MISELPDILQALPYMVLVLDRQGKIIRTIPTRKGENNAIWLDLTIAILQDKHYFQSLQTRISQVFDHRETVNVHYCLDRGENVPKCDRYKCFVADLSPLPENNLLWIARDSPLEYSLDEAIAIPKSALRQSEEQMRVTFEQSPIGMTLRRLDGTYLKANRAYCQLLGYSEAELRDKHWQEYTHPEDIAADLALDRQLVQGEIDNFEIEKRFIRKDGKIVYVLLKVALISNEKGEPLHVITQAVDITARKEIETALQVSEERWQLALGANNDGIWDWNVQTNEIFFSPSWKAMLGFAEDEMTNTLESWFQRIHPEDSDRVMQVTQDHLDGKTPDCTLEYRLQCKDGSYKWILDRGKALWDTEGKAIRMVGSHTDLGDRRQIEEEIHQTRNFLQTIIDRIPVALFVKDARDENFGTFKLWNKASERILGVSAEKAIGTNDYTHFPSEQADFFRQKDREIIARGFPEEIPEEPIDTQDLGRRILHTIKVPLYDPQGQPEYLLGISEDITDRKQAEVDLRNSEARYSSLTNDVLDKSAVGIFILDANFHIVWINRAIEIYFGLQREEIIGTDKRQLIGDRVQYIFADPDTFAQTVLATYDDNTYIEHFNCHVLANGERKERWIEHLSQPIVSGLYAGGRIEHYSDISDRHAAVQELKKTEALLLKAKAELELRVAQRTEELDKSNQQLQWELAERIITEAKLRESEKQYRTLVENFPQGAVFLFDRHFCYTIADGMRLQALGLSREQLENQIVWNVLPEEIARGVVPSYEAALRGETTTTELNYRDRIYYHQALPVRNESGEIFAGMAVVQEITERKRNEVILKDSEQQWRSFLESIPLLVVGLDSQGQVNYVNAYFAQVMGYTKEESIGKNWFSSFLPPAYQTSAQQDFAATIGDRKPVQNQYHLLTRSQEERTIIWNNTVMKNPQGEAIGTLSIGEDITERHAIERMKDEFISVVSHELRTPLTSIHGALNLLSSSVVDATSEKGERIIQIASESAERLVRLVNDILELERLESGKIKLDKKRVNAATLIVSAVEQMQVMAHREGIVFEIDADKVQFTADPDRLFQVLTNLLSNAIKFSEHGSTIFLSAKAVKLTGENAAILLTVKDEGRGIPSEKIEHIFERFHQVDASDSRKKGGTGLGLTICRSIVEQHGGRIWVESECDRGSCFYLQLPITHYQ